MHEIEPVHVPRGGGAHGYASAHCSHWLAGWCGRHGLPDDVSRRAECPLKGWTQGSHRCDHFERKLLPEAPEAVKADYGWRTDGVAKPVEAETAGPPCEGRPQSVGLSSSDRQCPGLDGKPCGVSLKPRRRLCDECRVGARRETARKGMAALRTKRVACVSS